jgi:hypothetical protein
MMLFPMRRLSISLEVSTMPLKEGIRKVPASTWSGMCSILLMKSRSGYCNIFSYSSSRLKFRLQANDFSGLNLYNYNENVLPGIIEAEANFRRKSWKF